MRATHAGVPLMQSAHSFGWQRRVIGGNGGTDGGAEPSICHDTPDPTRRLVRAEHASAEGATHAGVPLMQSAHSSGWQQRAGGGNGRMDGGAEPSVCRDKSDPTRRLVRAEHASVE